MGKKKCLWVWVFFWVMVMVLPGQGETELKSEIFENDTFRTRLWLKVPEYSLRCLGLASYALDGKIYRMAGLELPGFCFGPVAAEGLLKEVNNPLGYGAGSLVYRQPSRLRLNSAFQSRERLGLMLGPLAWLPAFFAVSKKQSRIDEEPELESWGCFVPWGLNESLGLELLWRYAPPDRGSATTDPAGLATWAGRAGFKETFRNGALSATISMAFSDSPVAGQGYFFTLQSVLQTTWLEVEGLWGASSPFYLTATCEQPALWQRAEVHTLLQIFTVCRLGGSYIRRVSHSTGREEAVCFPTKESITLETEACLPLSASRSAPELSLTAEIKKEQTHDEEGQLTETHQVTADARFTATRFQCELEYRYKTQAGAAREQRLQAGFGFHPSDGELTLKLEQLFTDTKSPLPPALELYGAWTYGHKRCPETKPVSAGHNRSGRSQLYMKLKHYFKTENAETIPKPICLIKAGPLASRLLVTIGWETRWP